MVEATILAIQKPNNMPDMINFLPRRKLTWRMVMCVMAPTRKRARKIAVIGSSRVVVGIPPMPAVGNR